MQLRDYQQELLQKIFTSWSQGNRLVMAQLPTAGGKSILIGAIAKTFIENGEGAMAVAHRKELILQNRDKIQRLSGLECGVIKAGYPEERHLDLHVASIQTLNRRKWRPDIGVLIYDEAHRSISKSYVDLSNQYPNAYIIGLTATPCRSDGQGFKHIFDDLVIGASPRDLIAQGYLSKYKIFAGKKIDTKGVKKVGGDYNEKQLQERAMHCIRDVYPYWQKHAEGKRTVLFAVGIEHSKKLIEEFKSHGVNAEHIDGSFSDSDREGVLERFKNGTTTVISNVGILTEGFDLDRIDCVQVVRPTCSLGLYIQMLGRGLRMYEGKKHCIILDHTDNWDVHGLPDEDREWSLEPVSLKPSRYTQECPDCGHIFQPLSHEKDKPIKKFIDEEGATITEHISVCPNCLTKFHWWQKLGGSGGCRTEKEDFGELQEISLDANPWAIALIDELRQNQISTSKKAGWIYYRLKENERCKDLSLGDWRYLAKTLGYKTGWAWKVYNEIQEQGADSNDDVHTHQMTSFNLEFLKRSK